MTTAACFNKVSIFLLYDTTNSIVNRQLPSPDGQDYNQAAFAKLNFIISAFLAVENFITNRLILLGEGHVHKFF